MIGWLAGNIIDKDDSGKLVLNVNGVGYDVETSMQTFFQIESEKGDVVLHIHTIVREDALLLYGFFDKQERSLFRALIKVNGIGPKVAMNILSSVSALDFAEAIHSKNLNLLTKLPGIGKKTAERLLIEMKDSILTFLQSEQINTSNISVNKINQNACNEAISALETLGYKAHDAIKVVKKLDDGSKGCEQLIRQALQVLSGKT